MHLVLHLENRLLKNNNEALAKGVEAAIRSFLLGSVDQVTFWHDRPVSHSALPIADAYVLDIDRNNSYFLTGYKAVAASILDRSIVPLERLGCGLIESIVLQMLLAVIFFLLCSARH